MKGPPYLLPKLLAQIVLASALVLAFSAGSQGKTTSEQGPDTVAIKIRLMAEALQASDAGDFSRAKEKLEALRAYSPADPQLTRLIQQADTHISDAEAARLHPTPSPVAPLPAPPPAAPITTRPTPPLGIDAVAELPVTPDRTSPQRQWTASEQDAEDLAASEASRQQGLITHAIARFARARDLAKEERFKEALGVISEASRDLPVNPLTQSLLSEMDSVRVDLEHRERVAAFSVEENPPALSLRKSAAPSLASGDAPPARIEVELQLLELSPSLVDDLFAAWNLYCQDATPITRKVTLDHDGKHIYQRPASRIPNASQLALYWAMKKDQDPSERPPIEAQAQAGAAGLVGRINTAALVQQLMTSKECRVLASPRLALECGLETTLCLTRALGPSPEPVADRPKPGWEISILPTLAPSSSRVLLLLAPRVVRYQGFIVPGAQNTALASYETEAKASLAKDETLALAGPIWSDARRLAAPVPSWARLPYLRKLHKAATLAASQREILILVQARPLP